jgi:ketosteroid isomerase-like protein
MAVPQKQVFRPDLAWWESVFAIIDAGDAESFSELLTPDATFRLGNSPALVGREAARAAAAAFFAAIGSSRHRVSGIWNGAATAVCEGEVTYRRVDHSTVTFPFVNVFELRGKSIGAYRLYIDHATLFDSPT